MYLETLIPLIFQYLGMIFLSIVSVFKSIQVYHYFYFSIMIIIGILSWWVGHNNAKSSKESAKASERSVNLAEDAIRIDISARFLERSIDLLRDIKRLVCNMNQSTLSKPIRKGVLIDRENLLQAAKKACVVLTWKEEKLTEDDQKVLEIHIDSKSEQLKRMFRCRIDEYIPKNSPPNSPPNSQQDDIEVIKKRLKNFKQPTENIFYMLFLLAYQKYDRPIPNWKEVGYYIKEPFFKDDFIEISIPYRIEQQPHCGKFAFHEFIDKLREAVKS